MSRRTAFNALLTIGGLALFVWQIEQAGGVGSIRDGVFAVGIGFLPILALSFARFVLRSYAWLVLLNQRAPLSAAIAATISGDALGNLTFLSLAASEPAKAVYLGAHINRTRAFAALTAENFFYTVSIAIYIIIGAAALLGTADAQLPQNVQLGGVGALLTMSMGLAAAAWVALKRPAIASTLLERLPVRALRKHVHQVRDFEALAYGSAGPGTAALLRLTAAEVTFHLLSYVEAWLTLYLLMGESRPVEALILDAVSRGINVIFKPIPMRFGVDEVSATQFATAIGIDAVTGTQTALVRKVRLIVWAAVGLVIWALRGRAAGRSEEAAIGEEHRSQ